MEEREIIRQDKMVAIGNGDGNWMEWVLEKDSRY